MIRTLTLFPLRMVQDGFWDLAADPSFSPRMREKFRRALDSVEAG